MKNWRLFGLVVWLILLCFMSSQSAAQEKMRVAIPLFPTAAFPVLVANDRGFFQKEGLTVEPIRINSAPMTYQALISGDVHAVAGAPTGLLPSHAQGADIIALGSWDNLVPYIWVTRDRISDVRELRGKKVGVNRAGSKPWLIIHVLLQDAGLDPIKDLTLLQMGGGSQERVAALMRGGIDATLADALFEPIMKQRGFSILRTKTTPFMNAPIAAKRSYITSNRTAMKKFVKAFADATRYIIDNKEGTLRPLTQLLNSNDPEVTDFAYQYLHANSEASLYPPDAAVKNLIRMSGYMDKKLASISTDRILDLSLLDEIGTKRHQRAQK
jgi:NitT/TauT family transport system substrate-binding protein